MFKPTDFGLKIIKILTSHNPSVAISEIVLRASLHKKSRWLNILLASRRSSILAVIVVGCGDGVILARFGRSLD